MAALICLVAVVVVAATVAVLVHFLGRQMRQEPYGVVVDLYAIRRRLEVAQFRAETKRDAAALQRLLRDELQHQSKSQRHRR